MGVAALAATNLTACVTNTEGGTPEGWKPILPAEVPEIAAMVPEEVAADGVLTAGTNPPFAPFEFKDSQGNVIGMEMDLGAAIASVMGLEYQAVEQDFSLILPSVQAGTVDMGISGFTDTDERRQNFDFVDFLYAGIQWARPAGGDATPSDPCGLSISVQRTTVSDTDDVRPKAQECIDSGQEEITVLSYDTSDNAALAALIGRADAFSADSPVTAWAVERSDGRLELVGDISQAAPYGMAVNKDSAMGPAVAAALQHLIDTGDYARILEQWGITEGLVDEALINEEPVEGVS
ncbi:ABC transporter substrate-binding protein [Corynebacterium uterequi]|uniref:ABC superfamily ATP binding cassette transporter, substrate-binding protein n=1 Tax=Corynebacterium uterequi TaxID=1072256 RepID=A0A0G3HIJ7_9CORY|nr:ABC transporter substrate-binding protein [Corynebacterium uterequi]AKK10987.1 ABC superfamily ATP binding cassette transporter, substrate-binding protein [Corynebacterium uterequi]